MAKIDYGPDWKGPGLDRAQAAAYLKVCPRTLDKLRASGTGPEFFRIEYKMRYWPAALQRFECANNSCQCIDPAACAAKQCANGVEPGYDWHLPEPGALLSASEVATFLGVSLRALAYWRAEGLGPAYTKQGQQSFYTGAALRAYLKVAEDPGA